MQYTFKYWYGAVTFTSPPRLYTLGTIIKSTYLGNARNGLEGKIRCYLEKNPGSKAVGRKLGRIRKVEVKNGFLKYLRSDIKEFSLDSQIE